MACWVCGDPNVTGEHLIKASALRALFGEVTQGRPLYFAQRVTSRGVSRIRRGKMQGIGSKLLRIT